MPESTTRKSCVLIASSCCRLVSATIRGVESSYHLRIAKTAVPTDVFDNSRSPLTNLHFGPAAWTLELDIVSAFADQLSLFIARDLSLQSSGCTFFKSDHSETLLLALEFRLQVSQIIQQSSELALIKAKSCATTTVKNKV